MIWPFTTIKRLRAEVVELHRECDLLRHYGCQLQERLRIQIATLEAERFARRNAEEVKWRRDAVQHKAPVERQSPALSSGHTMDSLFTRHTATGNASIVDLSPLDTPTRHATASSFVSGGGGDYSGGGASGSWDSGSSSSSVGSDSSSSSSSDSSSSSSSGD